MILDGSSRKIKNQIIWFQRSSVISVRLTSQLYNNDLFFFFFPHREVPLVGEKMLKVQNIKIKKKIRFLNSLEQEIVFCYKNPFGYLNSMLKFTIESKLCFIRIM